VTLGLLLLHPFSPLLADVAPTQWLRARHTSTIPSSDTGLAC
jgi:hypothetical protein